jgi:hypothetical protein
MYKVDTLVVQSMDALNVKKRYGSCWKFLPWNIPPTTNLDKLLRVRRSLLWVHSTKLKNSFMSLPYGESGANANFCKTCSMLLCVPGQPGVYNSSAGSNWEQLVQLAEGRPWCELCNSCHIISRHPFQRGTHLKS